MVNASVKQQRGGFLCRVVFHHFYLTFNQTNIKSILCSDLLNKSWIIFNMVYELCNAKILWTIQKKEKKYLSLTNEKQNQRGYVWAGAMTTALWVSAVLKYNCWGTGRWSWSAQLSCKFPVDKVTQFVLLPPSLGRRDLVQACHCGSLPVFTSVGS